MGMMKFGGEDISKISVVSACIDASEKSKKYYSFHTCIKRRIKKRLFLREKKKYQMYATSDDIYSVIPGKVSSSLFPPAREQNHVSSTSSTIFQSSDVSSSSDIDHEEAMEALLPNDYLAAKRFMEDICANHRRLSKSVYGAIYSRGLSQVLQAILESNMLSRAEALEIEFEYLPMLITYYDGPCCPNTLEQLSGHYHFTPEENRILLYQFSEVANQTSPSRMRFREFFCKRFNLL